MTVSMSQRTDRLGKEDKDGEQAGGEELFLPVNSF